MNQQVTNSLKNTIQKGKNMLLLKKLTKAIKLKKDQCAEMFD